ncbi:uncharacterized protein N7469_002454 [Penicillium citrinum]|uniref:Uncharacterized protein n=1 Tax=Penicillium citrinum TaxID=5077 RepID=A0A9W9TU93_PENCI|nr:uncharacterized protein N7469_002454 [Penicillium citrinum]KAJ5240863.1 hypothetical protein N7469_002454 [Penicillium citrinum]
MLNRLTSDIVNKASDEIKDGIRIPTDLPLDFMSKPCFGRAPFQQTSKTKHLARTQWDGFRHYGYQDSKKWFNNHTSGDILQTKVNGINGKLEYVFVKSDKPDFGSAAWVEKGGTVGRGILLDYAAWAENKGIAIDHFSPHSISASILHDIAESQRKELKDGDILFIRSGWVRAFSKLPDEQVVALAEMTIPPAVGLESSEETLRWIWESGFSAVA